eukprot:IDg16416t1
MSPPSSSIVSTGLPTSVRGAAPELRRLIRKRQNSESAKRCRMRRKIELQRETSSKLSTAAQVAQLEALVTALATRLHDTQTAVATLLARSSPATPQISSYGTQSYSGVHSNPASSYPSSMPFSTQSRPTTPTDIAAKLPLPLAHSPMAVLPPSSPEVSAPHPSSNEDLTATIVELEAALSTDRHVFKIPFCCTLNLLEKQRDRRQSAFCAAGIQYTQETTYSKNRLAVSRHSRGRSAARSSRCCA